MMRNTLVISNSLKRRLKLYTKKMPGRRRNPPNPISSSSWSLLSVLGIGTIAGALVAGGSDIFAVWYKAHLEKEHIKNFVAIYENNRRIQTTMSRNLPQTRTVQIARNTLHKSLQMDCWPFELACDRLHVRIAEIAPYAVDPAKCLNKAYLGANDLMRMTGDRPDRCIGDLEKSDVDRWFDCFNEFNRQMQSDFVVHCIPKK